MEDYKEILAKAQMAGMEALRKCVPTPVTFVESDLNDKPIGKSYYEPEGLCGGAYVSGLGGNSPFVRWAKKNNLKGLNKNVYKGYNLFIDHEDYYGQSAEKYEACARAFVQVLKDNGISCYAKCYLS